MATPAHTTAAPGRERTAARNSIAGRVQSINFVQESASPNLLLDEVVERAAETPTTPYDLEDTTGRHEPPAYEIRTLSQVLKPSITTSLLANERAMSWYRRFFPARERASSIIGFAMNSAASSKTSITRSSYCTAPSVCSRDTNGAVRFSRRSLKTVFNAHETRAWKLDLMQSSLEEINWSGFGQHVQFSIHDDLPFTRLHVMSATSRAIVDAVRCRRICLARKTMMCHRRFTPEEALEEVRHLQSLHHRHVVRCVGSYVQGKRFAILTYPLAQCNLYQYMRDPAQMFGSLYCGKTLAHSFGCLCSAMAFIHKAGIKHMDIKPQNILLGQLSDSVPWAFSEFPIYFTDFGISRAVDDENQSKTDGPTGRTEMYCSPEVAAGEPRGRSSDIFSLGCVFAEMATVIATKTLDDFQAFRSEDGSSFYCNLFLVYDWIEKLGDPEDCWEVPWESVSAKIISMLQEDQYLRPSAQRLGTFFGPNACCDLGSVPFALDTISKGPHDFSIPQGEDYLV